MAQVAMTKPRSRTARGIYAGLGLLFVGLGIVGYIVPGMPSTVFFICSLFFFKKSSAKLEAWLLNNRFVGATLRDWDENHWISKRTKAVAISCIVVFSTLSCFLIRPEDPTRAWLIRGAIALLALIGVGYISMCRTKPDSQLN
jgi:uncharacterized membrane protein YbaN (DUF454 family)